MSQAEFEKFKPVLSKTLSILLILFGLFRVVRAAFAFPTGQELDRALLFQTAAGIFYAVSGLFFLSGKASFEKLYIVLFVCFMLEMSQIAAY